LNQQGSTRKREINIISALPLQQRKPHENINIPSVLKLGTQDQARKLLFIEERRK
jgi:hypothetical protein